MIPIIGITGPSGSGKTALAVKLISELKQRGYKVAAIKHTRHQVDVDRPGKDSMMYYEAGAAAVSLASPDKVAVIMPSDEQWSPEDIALRLFPEVDLVLVEGFGDAAIPRIGVARKNVSAKLPDQKGLIGLVTDLPAKSKVPVFSFEQVPAIADLLEGYIKRLGPKRDVRLDVNGRKIMIKPFIKDFFLKTIAAMVDSLKGTQAARRIQILIDKPAGEDRE
ncbi:MAG TPA: molybdopterin-guanine dinucleotide biosynthesis protein B [bacterium]|nr:molybdopterin-guanine dinucleotide biosynthesis protein B [bacterium]